MKIYLLSCLQREYNKREECNTTNNRLENCFRYFIVSRAVVDDTIMMTELTRIVPLQLQIPYMLL